MTHSGLRKESFSWRWKISMVSLKNVIAADP
jgi:hypothetical protein